MSGVDDLKKTIVQQIMNRHDAVAKVVSIIDRERDARLRLMFREAIEDAIEVEIDEFLDDVIANTKRVLAVYGNEVIKKK